MKKIRLDISQDRVGYRVYVGTGTYFKFNSKLQAKRFLATYRVLVTDHTRALRVAQGNLYGLYSFYYFQLPDHIEYKIRATLQEFDNRFNYIFKDFTKGNNNHFVMHNLGTCFSSLEESLLGLKSFAQKNKHYCLIHQTSALLLSLTNNKACFESSLKDYTPSIIHRTKVIPLSVIRTEIL